MDKGGVYKVSGEAHGATSHSSLRPRLVRSDSYYYRARYYDASVGRFLSEDPAGFNAGGNFFEYVYNNPVQRRDAFGLKPCTSCGLIIAPEYSVTGTVEEGTGFSWHAKFKNDSTHDPACCEVRQFISWNRGGAPHGGFPRDAHANRWYEDRSEQGKIYGRRTGKGAFSDKSSNLYHGNEYNGWDRPSGWDTGDIVSYQLKVVDVCNGGKIIYTSKAIHVTF